MNEFPKQQNWLSKFKNATSGMLFAFKDQRSFWVHLPAAVLVVALAVILNLDLSSICILLLCISTVMTAELLNSSIEYLAKSITEEHDDRIGKALDIAGGSVLLASIFATVVGIITFAPAIIGLLQR